VIVTIAQVVLTGRKAYIYMPVNQLFLTNCALQIVVEISIRKLQQDTVKRKKKPL
jgi:hypothetical protein